MTKNHIKISLSVLGAVVLAIAAAAYLWKAGPRTQPDQTHSGPLEKIAVGTAFNRLSGLWYIVKDQGYDKAQGLEVDLRAYPAGINAVKDLEAGELDLACCAEFILVSEIFAGAADLRCLASFAAGAHHQLIVRRDRGIVRPEDLRGKSIGVPHVHSAMFFLGRFISLNHIPLKEVNLADLSPNDLADALAAGKVDAVVARDQRFYDTMRMMGINAFSWPSQGGQDLYWMLVSREEVVKKRGPALEKVLRALGLAADFIRRQPEAGMAVMARWTQIPLADLQGFKQPIRFELFLDQALLLAMEDQARWMMDNKLTGRVAMPDFLDYFAAEPLTRVDPKAMRVIIPQRGKQVRT